MRSIQCCKLTICLFNNCNTSNWPVIIYLVKLGWYVQFSYESKNRRAAVLAFEELVNRDSLHASVEHHLFSTEHNNVEAL